MKKRIILAISAMFILGLTVAAFALSQSSKFNNTTAAADSCAMKMQVAGASRAKASCCDKADCCCKGDACPMKKQGSENASAGCCSNCCGDSCAMKNKTSETSSADMNNPTVAAGEGSCCQKGASCCNGGACCKGKKS